MRKRYLAISIVCFAISLLIAVSCFAGSFVFRDEFSTARDAGAVHNSAAEPGSGVRTVVDTENKLSIANGALTFSGGKATPAWADPMYRTATEWTRAAGLTVIGDITLGNATTWTAIGWRNTGGSGPLNGFQFNSTGGILPLTTTAPGATNPIVGTYTGITYTVAVPQRAAGAYFFIKGGAFTNWTLMWVDNGATTNQTPMHVAVNNYNQPSSSSFLRIPSTLWLPSPLISDSFATTFGTSDGAGHAESTGLGSGGSGKVWSNAGSTWSVSSAKAINTPVAGTSLVDAAASTFESGIYNWATLGTNTVENDSGALKITYVDNEYGAINSFRDASDLTSDLTVGAWYQIQTDAKVNAGSSVTLLYNSFGFNMGFGVVNSTDYSTKTGTFRAGHATDCVMWMTGMATGEIIWLDNWTLKPLTLSQLISVTETSTRDVIATVAISTTPAGTQAGLAVGIDSATDPKYGVIAYHDGTNAKLDKLVNGTWTSVISASATFSANAEIRVIRDGTSFRLYYNNKQIGATSTISDVGDGTLHGLFNTHTTPMDDFTVYARGTGGEYSNLNALMSPPRGGMFLGMGFCF